MSLTHFTCIDKARGIYERGNDTCAHPKIVMYAPAERVAAADKWLVRIYDPRSAQFATMVQRSNCYAANTRRAEDSK